MIYYPRSAGRAATAIADHAQALVHDGTTRVGTPGGPVGLAAGRSLSYQPLDTCGVFEDTSARKAVVGG